MSKLLKFVTNFCNHHNILFSYLCASNFSTILLLILCDSNDMLNIEDPCKTSKSLHPQNPTVITQACMDKTPPKLTFPHMWVLTVSNFLVCTFFF